jgi:hypothetical protein
MLPKGAVWQRLRARALDAVPSGTLIPYASPSSISDWLTKGAISVLARSSKRFEISAVPTEVGGALFSDSAFHLDHATEHAVHLRHELNSGRWRSGAWLTVTFYYWAYFVVLSLTRTTGLTGVFLTRDIASDLSTLAGGAPFGAGPVTMICKPSTSIGHRDIELRRTGRSRLHDLTWYLWFETLREARKEAASTQRDPAEDRLYEVLQRSATVLGDGWPSDLRNLINYRPGFGYGAIRRTTRNSAFATIEVESAQSWDTVLARLETNTASLNATALEFQAPLATKVLVDMTFILDTIARALHTEVIERRSIDPRWLRARNGFGRDQGADYDTPVWPVSV